MSFLIGPPMRAWVRSRMAERPPLVMPDDAPVVRVEGSDPRRVLLVGSGPAAGVGVRTHALGLTGALARALAARDGRGAVVESIGRPDLELRDVVRIVEGRGLAGFDVVIVVAGTVEAMSLATPAQWAAELRAVLRAIRTGSAGLAVAVVVGMPPVTTVGSGSGWRGHLADRRAALLNRASAAVAAADGAGYVPLSAPASVSALPTAAWYTDWAEEIASGTAFDPDRR